MIDLTGFEGALQALKARDRYRSLTARTGHDFASNDYLALANSAMLREAAMAALARGVPLGAGGSRLLRGNSEEHEALEAEAALHYGCARTLFMGGGFVANSALFSTLPRKGDLIVHDELIHASAHDGMRLGKAETLAFRHNDINHAGDLIAKWRAKGQKGMVWIAVESIYSMDGDGAPVNDLIALADHYHAMLVVDEAHATGVFGAGGRGRFHAHAGADNLLSLHTCGKALGVQGALVCGASVFIETLINKARGFIYATAPSPLNAALVRAALAGLNHATSPHDSRQAMLADLVAHAHREVARFCGLSGLFSQIIPFIVGEAGQTMALAGRLQAQGFDVRGIRPPTVARGTARLRIPVTLNVNKDIVSQLFETLGEARPPAQERA